MAFGISNVQAVFKRQRKIIPVTFSSTTADSVSFISSTDLDDNGKALGANFDITIAGVSGDTYVTPLSTAPTSTNAFSIQNLVMDFKVEDRLALTSSSTTATYQAIVWEG